MNLFRRWSQSDWFKQAWAVSIGTYSAGFQAFCEDTLRLKLGAIEWKFPHVTEISGRELLKLEQHFKPKIENSKKEISDWPKYIGEPDIGNLVMQAQMVVKYEQRELRFPIGLIVFEIIEEEQNNRDSLVIKYFRIRDFYRDMELLDKMLDSLDKLISDLKLGMKIQFATTKARKQFRYYFEQRGIEVIECA